MAILELSESMEERLWSKTVLEENIQTVSFTTSGSQRLLCVWFYIQSSKRQASRIVLRLHSRKLYWCRLRFPPSVWSDISASSFRTKNVWVLFQFQWTIL